jgi:hypothetical protein
MTNYLTEALKEMERIILYDVYQTLGTLSHPVLINAINKLWRE